MQENSFGTNEAYTMKEVTHECVLYKIYPQRNLKQGSSIYEIFRLCPNKGYAVPPPLGFDLVFMDDAECAE